MGRATNQDGTASTTKNVVPAARLPLAYVSEEGAVYIRFEDGGHVTFAGGRHRSSRSIFSIALWGSLHLGGRPVRCDGIVPGVSLRVETGIAEASDNEAIRLSRDLWDAVRSRLAQWLAQGPDGASKFGMAGRGLQLEFTWNCTTGLRPGAMQIDVEYAEAFERAYIASRAHRPLIELPPGVPEPPVTVETSARATLIRRAMEQTIMADSPLYERLPIPVRYRAAGAIEAWKRVREDAGRSGEAFSRRLTSEPIGALMHNFPKFLEAWAGGNLACIGDEDDMGHAQRSVVMQAFSASHGALYEPTLALHRLLDDAYIADDVPVHLIRLPVDTLCIVPDPSW